MMSFRSNIDNDLAIVNCFNTILKLFYNHSILHTRFNVETKLIFKMVDVLRSDLPVDILFIVSSGALIDCFDKAVHTYTTYVSNLLSSRFRAFTVML